MLSVEGLMRRADIRTKWEMGTEVMNQTAEVTRPGYPTLILWPTT